MFGKSKDKQLVIYVDAASRGNPGQAGVGVVINDENNNEVKQVSKYIGKTTNNIAEYTGLIVALQEALKLGASKVVVNTDSELVAKQWSGEYRVKEESLKVFYKIAKNFEDGFAELKVNNVKREDNKQADKLANKAIDDMIKDKNR